MRHHVARCKRLSRAHHVTPAAKCKGRSSAHQRHSSCQVNDPVSINYTTYFWFYMAMNKTTIYCLMITEGSYGDLCK